MTRQEGLRVLVVNGPMQKVQDMHRRGLIPAHHLFGAPELAAEYNMQVTIARQDKSTWLSKLGELFDISSLDQQIEALFSLRKYDVIYAPYGATNTKLIIVLKLLGIIRKPIVILVHHPLFGRPSKNKWKRWLIKKLIVSYDTIIFFSKRMKEELVDAYHIDSHYAEKIFFVSPLGADVDFFKTFLNENTPEDKRFVMSSGNTERDFEILVRAAERIAFPFKIYCKPESYPKSVNIPDHVEILSGDFPFDQICGDLAAARIVLIPLKPNPQATTGLVSVLEALALGKPIVMSRNEKIDVDFECDNVGLEVNGNSPEEWVAAIQRIIDDYSQLKQMGDNSLRLANGRFHLNMFVKRLAKALEGVAKKSVRESKSFSIATPKVNKETIKSPITDKMMGKGG